MYVANCLRGKSVLAGLPTPRQKFRIQVTDVRGLQLVEKYVANVWIDVKLYSRVVFLERLWRQVTRSSLSLILQKKVTHRDLGRSDIEPGITFIPRRL
jgi:hypothetical protein